MALAVTAIPSSASAQAVIVDHDCVAEFDFIPASVIRQARTDYRIFYGHTSHGSQPVTGMEMLYAEDIVYAYNSGVGTLQLVEIEDDLGAGGDISWAPITRSYLDNPSYDFNVVIWSWCGGVAYTSEAGIDIYLQKFTELENEYPDVTFVYMTGHLNTTGPDGSLYRGNNQIRDYCLANGKLLYDFADIESYDPDGIYYPYEDDECNWCYDWCAVHTCPACVLCMHSHCFNCYLKGKAFWWMMATLTGWQMPVSVDDAAGSGISEMFSLEQNFPNPFNPSTTIEYHLPSQSPVDMAVYNLLGQRVRRLVFSSQLAGVHRAVWDGTDQAGRPVASGVYFYRLKTDTFTGTRKMVLQR